jgi:hypothetical protein
MIGNQASPKKWLLRLKGVNMGSFIFDTRDLSTIRGGSLLLLDMARNKAQEFLQAAGATCIETIRLGASIALFAFHPGEGRTAEEVRKAIEEKLEVDDQLKHATFVVDVEPLSEDSDFREAVERILARNHWRQYQASTVSLPEPPDHPTDPVTCTVDGLRPAWSNRAGRNGKVSEGTWQRRDFGKDRKQQFYFDQSGLSKEELPCEFANEFEEIAKPIPGAPLGNKMAVFYADGNKFSSVLRELCTDQAKQTAWDEYIRGKRQHWLKAFLQEQLAGQENDGWLYRENGKTRYRFETLLWGGDEVMFVMPAWMGWRFAGHFFKAAEQWNLKGELTRGDRWLTHTAALVFCHHHSPIHRIKRLAKEGMAEFAKNLKDEHGGELGRCRNQLVYQILESFDHLGGNVEAAIDRRVGKCCAAKDLVLTGSEDQGLAGKLQIIGKSVADLQDGEFPRSQLRSLVTRLVNCDTRINASLECNIGGFAKGSEAEREKIKKALEGMRGCVSHDGAFWFHLEELWDYSRP